MQIITASIKNMGLWYGQSILTLKYLYLITVCTCTMCTIQEHVYQWSEKPALVILYL